MNAPSAYFLVPLLVSVLFAAVIVTATVVTVRRDRRAGQWMPIRRQRPSILTARRAAALRAAQPLADRDAA